MVIPQYSRRYTPRPPVSSEAVVPVITVCAPSPSELSASVKQFVPFATPGHVGAMDSTKCAEEPGSTRSRSADTAAVVPTRCGGNEGIALSDEENPTRRKTICQALVELSCARLAS